MQSYIRRLEVTPLSHFLQAITFGLSTALYDARRRMSGLSRLLLAAFLFALALGMPVSSFAQGPCGGNGQRACCVLGFEFAPGGGACDSGLSYSPAGCNDPNGCSCVPIPSESSSAMCYQATPCGNAGQRACCDGDGEFASNHLACEDGLVQPTGTCSSSNAAACVCGGSSGGFEYASGICVQPAACGGAGQRACCTGLTETAISGQLATCASGLTEVPGCSGDCTCGGSTSLGEPDGNSCTTIATISEPPTNATPTTNESGAKGTWTLPQASLPAGPECPSTGLCGYADLHVHMFANLAHGGATLAGEPWDVNGVNAALGEDYGSGLNLVKGAAPEPIVDGSAGLPECPSFLLNSPLGNLCTGQVLFHGDHTAFDTVTGGGTNDGANSNLGVPLFNGWPLWTSTIHQQVYYKWLERAWLGGLRLMVMDAVTNEALCKSGTIVLGTDCTSSMTAIDAELLAAQNFQTWLDTQYGGPGQGWFQIVTTPQQATSVIQQGKLAVVLGIEVDNLFNCHLQGTNGQPFNGEGPACTQSTVQQQLQKYYGMGVRHIFPIHNFDNAYGTPAAWQDPINVGNIVAEGDWWNAGNCTDSGYGFYLDPVTDAALYGLGFGGVSVPLYPTFTSGSCHNPPGLTSLGTYLIQQAMSMGMIIDVDHMSINAFNETINLANTQSPAYAGIAATHVQFFDLYNQNYTGHYGRHERMRTYAQLQSIKDAGGMIAAMLKDDVQDTSNGWCLPQGNCPFGASNTEGGEYFTNYNGPNAPSNNGGALNNNCRYSTTEWAQAYLYGVQAMGGPVAMGSDFNGIAGHVGPRFGNGACGGDPGQRASQEFAKNRLMYPFMLEGFGTFGQQVSGQKTYDFNVDGLAHIGLLPDMVADLMKLGVTNEQLQPLFGSAQAYITMWQQASQIPPSITSGNTTTFTVGTAGSFTVTSTGTPTPTFSETGALPGGVTLDTTTGVLSGTPTAGSGGVYSILITASNGISPSATQIFTLTVDQAPAITSTSTATTFTVGAAGSFTATATGYPAPTFSETGALPGGVTLNTATGVLSGAPAAGSGGLYHITITASNGVSPNGTQSFTLTVDQAPAITSTSTATTFTVGAAGSFTVTATGYPAPTFSETGALPGGVTLNPTTGLLGGTPTAGGVYNLTIITSNGVSPNATQNFTLTVDQAPAITTSGMVTFRVGIGYAFTVTAVGYPAPTFSETGALPGGVTLNPTTGLLSGIAAAGTGGVYNITIIASNGVSPNATQSFTLTVDQVPAITSASTATFTVGAAGSFTVAATGYPAPTFSETGALPGGVTLNTTTGALSGTPAAGSGGVYNITITASNGVLPNATQSFTLSVQDFTISASPTSETVPLGLNAVYTVAVTSLGGLTGDVSLACSGAPPNSTCTVSPSSVALAGTSTVTIHFSAPKNVDLGTFTPSFTGNLATLTHSTSVNLTVK
jgi:microsomal dipeptidase-like Zn-dependent dipeptidase